MTPGRVDHRLDADDDFAARGELDAVADEVEQDLPEPAGSPSAGLHVAADDGGEVSFFPRLGGRRARARLHEARTEFSRRDGQLAGLDLGEVEHVVDERSSIGAFDGSVAHSRCRGSSRVCASSSTMPIMPLNGVRISWLMLARNSLLAALARWPGRRRRWPPWRRAGAGGSCFPARPWFPARRVLPACAA